MHSSTVRDSSSEPGLGLDSCLKLKLFIKFNMYFIRYNLPKSIIISRLLFKIYSEQLLYNLAALYYKIFCNSLR
jgi:hypothetical protein